MTTATCICSRWFSDTNPLVPALGVCRTCVIGMTVTNAMGTAPRFNDPTAAAYQRTWAELNTMARTFVGLPAAPEPLPANARRTGNGVVLRLLDSSPVPDPNASASSDDAGPGRDGGLS